MHQPKASTNDLGVLNQCPDLIGFGIGHDVEVFRFDVSEEIADTTTHEKSLESCFLQLPNRFTREVWEEAGFDAFRLEDCGFGLLCQNRL